MQVARPGRELDPFSRPELDLERGRFERRLETMAHPSKYMNSLDQAAHALGDLDPRLRELIRIRASQLNGCAYCLSMHSEDARKAGEEQIRLDVLAGWREAGELFDERERAALALVDAITLMRDSGAAYDAAAEHFTEQVLEGLLWQAIAINAWNREAVTTHTRPEPATA
jgi:AhpD family alkylhydroperoxidase